MLPGYHTKEAGLMRMCSTSEKLTEKPSLETEKNWQEKA